MWKLLTTLASPGGARGTLTVLFFHRVFARVDPMMPGEPTAKSFDTLLGWVQSQFNVLPLAEGVRRLANHSLPPAAAAITFDDGYRDNLDVAAPLLQRRGLPATFFIASGFLDGGIMFNDVVIECMRRCPMEEILLSNLDIASLSLRTWPERGRAAGIVLRALKYLPFKQRADAVQRLPIHCRVELPNDLMLTSEQVRAMAAQGFEIGAHTDHHPILARVSDDMARAEITRGRNRLEAIAERSVRLFAFPNGRWGLDFDQRHCDMAKACGFDAAFSTEPSVCHAGSHLWCLPRFTPWDRTELKFRLRLLTWQRRRAEQTPAPARQP
ncbi:MAG: polysaccharide deacetylase family protein [Burkholderiaceae bacterium]|nr:polysaccharide deacetylase family protein [Burkholderiaceae bacterium]